ncbi:hypothetical protein OG948_59405 (plasmid) [Embleya sp. NBC_00888]|uniref:hypothetical protein n=1 Tax=Embleya sp. NBC_00888 TaxID=2975960 RepID=UPI002F90CA42|nr:hypothetical protein OG948_00030 [Embleya sp. NBC_00888]WSY43329.1 hypothetical protein OG948_34035 [Embleya sp. NBC_00888]WSY43719.1 hypothetical protein OG948_34090 [Embleya sp. NBC_00888]WSY48129.1 hypothetical protein OG948_59405 [Embleya sp. NBC_00888]
MKPLTLFSRPAPPVTLITDDGDDAALARAARQCSDPRHGRITVDPTPATVTSTFLARDILSALGRTAYVPTHGRAITAAPAWRAVACWFTVDDIRQLILLRAHLLTPDRTERLAALRATTGIHLVLIANPPGRPDTARLDLHLAEAGLAGELQRLDGVHAALGLFVPPTTPNRFRPPFAAPQTQDTGLPAERPRTSNPADTPSSRAQHRAGQNAAKTWLARHRITPSTPPDQADLELFLSRLTTLSPNPGHTTARVQGAQAGFAAHGLRLTVPTDLEAAGGPGICTVPFTAHVAHRVSRAVPHPVQLSALATLLFTGAHPDQVAATTVDGIDENGTRLALPEQWSRDHDPDSPPPLVWYTVPPRARPILEAARMFRVLEEAPGHYGLFSTSFGHRLQALRQDADHPIPTFDHPHTGHDWHHQARLTRN